MLSFIVYSVMVETFYLTSKFQVVLVVGLLVVSTIVDDAKHLILSRLVSGDVAGLFSMFSSAPEIFTVNVLEKCKSLSLQVGGGSHFSAHVCNCNPIRGERSGPRQICTC